jgi:HD-GYP domain-containing protein (c-di-GMP phosphodiesterase class II)
MIAAVRLMHEFEYFLCHPVHSAILAINLATLLKYDHPRMVRLVCAALTQNVSMNALQATLHIQEQRPTDEQMIRIQAHPLETVALLKNAGVTDDVWLNTVLQHHERMDGKGYPHGIKGDELIEEAKIIGLVDRYAAMLSRRAYRIPMETERLIRNLGAGRDTECDGRLTMLLIGSLGVYPPGSFVTLNNREGAIVIRRTQNPKRPIVCSYISPEGEHYKAPITRNLLVTEMNIKGHTSPVPDTSVDLNRFWGYVKN